MLYTIGHSTHPLEEFVGLLQKHGIDTLVDVRTVPRSRTNPQYNLDTLPESLAEHGIAHHYNKGLGGLRHSRPDSPNMGWRNASFRGYADYMATPEFDEALSELVARTEQGTVAIMCAEAVWWRCHRSMVAEAMIVRGHEAQHIMPDGRLNQAKLRDFAVVDGTSISYPPEPDAVP